MVFWGGPKTIFALASLALVLHDRVAAVVPRSVDLVHDALRRPGLLWKAVVVLLNPAGDEASRGELAKRLVRERWLRLKPGVLGG
jgi:hypothetical protein